MKDLKIYIYIHHWWEGSCLTLDIKKLSIFPVFYDCRR